MRKICVSPVCLIAAAAVLLTGGMAMAQAIDAEGDALDAALKARASKVIGPSDFPSACSECHAAEAAAWKQTHHFATFENMHRQENAEKIIKAMGGRSIKRDATCLQCHYTSKLEDDRLKPMWGISCESCHGQAQDWVQIHTHVGGDLSAPQLKPGESKTAEKPEQRAARLAKAAEKGMINSQMLYQIATNCFGCHTVPNEKLVNVGGHKAGSDFDLVAWSQGEVLHNFASSPDGKTNHPASAEMKRKLFVTGALVDMQFTLQNLAKAAGDGAFKAAMTERGNGLRAKLDKIAAAGVPEVAEALKAVPAKFDAGTKVDAAAAQKVAQAAQEFVKNHDGSKLAAIDPMLPAADQYKGKPAP